MRPRADRFGATAAFLSGTTGLGGRAFTAEACSWADAGAVGDPLAEDSADGDFVVAFFPETVALGAATFLAARPCLADDLAAAFFGVDFFGAVFSAVVVFGVAFFAAAFFGAVFLAADFLAVVVLATDFLAAVVFGADFFAAVVFGAVFFAATFCFAARFETELLTVGFLPVGFLAAGLLAGAFFGAGFLTAAFFDAAFFAVPERAEAARDRVVPPRVVGCAMRTS